MKKYLVLLFSIFILANIPVFSDDLWDNYGDHNAYGKQQFVSDQDFDKAVESKKRKKKRDKNVPKGEAFHKANETQSINVESQEPNILCVPAILVFGETNIPVGHYQVMGEKKNGKPVLKLYQAHYLIAEIPAIETQDDYEQESVNFVKMLEYSDSQLKLIFGSLDFNAYSIVDIAE